MKKRKQIVVIIIELLVLTAVVGGFIYVNSLINSKRPTVMQTRTPEKTEKLSATSVDAEQDVVRYDDDDYTNYLLIGLDVRNQSNMDHSNSDTMIIASINNVTGNVRLVSVYRDTVMNVGLSEDDPIIGELETADPAAYDGTGIGIYDKANSAYQRGGMEQAMRMMELNLDIKIDGCFVVNFTAVSDVIDDLDGLDIWMTKQEVIHMNNYCVETSAVTGKEYTPIEPEEEAREYHLNGIQAVSYARIRYTAGNDMKRTQRQRVVIHRILEKARDEAFTAIKSTLTKILPNCRTTIPMTDLFAYAANLQYYGIEKTTGFPELHIERNCVLDGQRTDPVVPVTLAHNVEALHKFLFNDVSYVASPLVQVLSNGIERITGLGEESIPLAEQVSEIMDSGGEADLVR